MARPCPPKSKEAGTLPPWKASGLRIASSPHGSRHSLGLGPVSSKRKQFLRRDPPLLKSLSITRLPAFLPVRRVKSLGSSCQRRMPARDGIGHWRGYAWCSHCAKRRPCSATRPSSEASLCNGKLLRLYKREGSKEQACQALLTKPTSCLLELLHGAHRGVRSRQSRQRCSQVRRRRPRSSEGLLQLSLSGAARIRLASPVLQRRLLWAEAP